MATQGLSTDSDAKMAGTVVVLQAFVAALIARHADRDGIPSSVADMPAGVRESEPAEASPDTTRVLRGRAPGSLHMSGAVDAFGKPQRPALPQNPAPYGAAAQQKNRARRCVVDPDFRRMARSHDAF
jgi:hypothetical protein